MRRSEIIRKFENLMMKDGKKEKARKIVRGVRGSVGDSVLFQAIENTRPFFAIKKLRVAGHTIQIPILIRKEKQIGLALRWIIQDASNEKHHISSNTASFRGPSAGVGSRASFGSLTVGLNHRDRPSARDPHPTDADPSQRLRPLQSASDLRSDQGSLHSQLQDEPTYGQTLEIPHNTPKFAQKVCVVVQKAAKNQGPPVQRKLAIHKTAELNKNLLRYRLP